jgi:hypothetical protein
MFKRYFTVIVTILVVNLFLCSAAFAKESNLERAEKTKVAVAKLGTGTDAKVQVKLYDGTKLKGYITEISSTGFSVMNEKTQAVNEVQYSAAKQVKGNNLSTGVKIAIGVGIGIAATILVLYLIVVNQDGF